VRQIRADNSKCSFPVLIPRVRERSYPCAVGSWDHGGRLSVSEEDSNALAGRLRDAHGVCEEYEDTATASLIEIWIDETESAPGSCSRQDAEEILPGIETSLD
jgi:hypothetical protein